MCDGQELPKGCRFITPNYEDLFTIPDGGKVVITYLDREKVMRLCHRIDDYHIEVGRNIFHICEFAERCASIGATYAPEHPRQKDCTDTYEIYQIPHTAHCNYLFMPYLHAQGGIRAADYKRVYAGMLGKRMSLEDLFQLHNQDRRPMSREVRALSISDLVVVNRAGKRTAFYVDTVGFSKVPFLGERLWKREHTPQQKEVKPFETR